MTLTATRTDPAAWDRLIGDAVREPDAALSNLKVTRIHYLLSQALREVVGAEDGANFHTWAVWGSRKAGVTIRQEGLERAMREVTILALCTGLLTSFLLGLALSPWLPGWVAPALAAVGAAAGAWTGRRWLAYGRRRAAELMLAGNRTVLEDIGGQTARFVTWFSQAGRHEPAALRQFLDGFRAGRAEEGGQDLLYRTFEQYYRAAHTDDPVEKQQATYYANCLAILHEHVRLQPYIGGSLPWIVRRCVTWRLMRYDVGPLRLAVGDDVPRLDGLDYPEQLRDLTDPELVEFLHGPGGLDPGAVGLVGTAARDWTRLGERMRYVVNLFRALHLHPDVFTAPYTAAQFEQIRMGQVPPGPL
jgi:hypothetical protein